MANLVPSGPPTPAGTGTVTCVVVTLVAVALTVGDPYVAGHPPPANVVATDEVEKTALVEEAYGSAQADVEKMVAGAVTPLRNALLVAVIVPVFEPAAGATVTVGATARAGVAVPASTAAAVATVAIPALSSRGPVRDWD